MMWARVVEVMLGSWLALSPIIFRHAADQPALWLNDLLCSLAIILFALLSFWHPLRQAHLALCGVALWLIGFGLLASPPPAPPALQNHILVGLLLFMFAIVPNEASLPPYPWRDFSSRNKSTGMQTIAKRRSGEPYPLKGRQDRQEGEKDQKSSSLKDTHRTA